MQHVERTDYPVRFSVDYPDHSFDRLTTFFRPFAAIPILIVVGLVAGAVGEWDAGEESSRSAAASGGLLFAATLVMIFVRQKYPRWWFDWNLELSRFVNRVAAYLFLLRDEYPSTDEEQSVHLELPYPDVPHDLNRWMPLVKWFLAIPHFFVLAFLWLAAVFAVVIAWFAIMFTGTYPRSIFDFVVGVMRWQNRVIAYAFTLVTDEYPPFSLTS